MKFERIRKKKEKGAGKNEKDVVWYGMVRYGIRPQKGQTRADYRGCWRNWLLGGLWAITLGNMVSMHVIGGVPGNTILQSVQYRKKKYNKLRQLGSLTAS